MITQYYTVRKSALIILTCHSILLRAEEVVIASFDHNGQISFNEVTDAIRYRIEWSPAVNGVWTNFAGDLGVWMGNIPAADNGIVTVAVPMVYRVVAQLPPVGMVYVPAGSFMMGNATNVFSAEEGEANELPQHNVNLNAFYIDKYEVTRSLWVDVRIAANSWGYSFSNDSIPNASSLPMTEIPWYDAVKWCNARSQVEGLAPVYYTDAGFTNIYMTGEANPYADWSANGYRLPTEAEWEKAARGGINDLRFPWDDFTNKISHAKANYYALFNSYDLSEGEGVHPSYSGQSSPVGSFDPNPYGIYDMAGNTWEWCWDWFDGDYYASASSLNPVGPVNGSDRVVRGGSFDISANNARCSARQFAIPSEINVNVYSSFSFRCVRNP